MDLHTQIDCTAGVASRDVEGHAIAFEIPDLSHILDTRRTRGAAVLAASGTNLMKYGSLS